ncbi:MAG: hypothetical protein AAF745_03455, partial [Planctomycetota bacterium]
MWTKYPGWRSIPAAIANAFPSPTRGWLSTDSTVAVIVRDGSHSQRIAAKTQHAVADIKESRRQVPSRVWRDNQRRPVTQ